MKKIRAALLAMVMAVGLLAAAATPAAAEVKGTCDPWTDRDSHWMCHDTISGN